MRRITGFQEDVDTKEHGEGTVRVLDRGDGEGVTIELIYAGTIPACLVEARALHRTLGAMLDVLDPRPEEALTGNEPALDYATKMVWERRRQVVEEAFTAQHDRTVNGDGQLAQAAGCYALSAGYARRDAIERLWPWDADWYKPSDPRRNLIKAGALILAELERLDRVEGSNG